MSRDPRYQRLLNDRRWRELRIAYLREHPLCERCIREGKAAGVPEGYITPSIDVHHRVPVETAKTLQEMERLAYDWNNLEALCIPCHSRTHREMGKGTKALAKQRAQERHTRWIDSMTKRFTNTNNDNGQHQDTQHGGDGPR
jgi:5-methylcytosine-specific restriction protein A